MDEHKQVPIWFFVGMLLLVYGLIITAEGVYNLFPGHTNPDLALQWLHADLWWGIVLTVLGGFYASHYFPAQKKE